MSGSTGRAGAAVLEMVLSQPAEQAPHCRDILRTRNTKGFTALYELVYSGYFHVLRRLGLTAADLMEAQHRSHGTFTVLHLAVWRELSDVVEFICSDAEQMRKVSDEATPARRALFGLSHVQGHHQHAGAGRLGQHTESASSGLQSEPALRAV